VSARDAACVFFSLVFGRVGAVLKSSVTDPGISRYVSVKILESIPVRVCEK